MLWLLIGLTSGGDDGPDVVQPDQVCIHDVVAVSPSLSNITHVAPGIEQVTALDCVGPMARKIKRSISGARATARPGTVVPSITVVLTGASAVGSAGTVVPLVTEGSDVTVGLTGAQASGVAGSCAVTLEIPVVGAEGTASAGDVSDTPTEVLCASCSQADVQAGITVASSGQIVRIPAGACTWTAPVTIPAGKVIHLKGAGVGLTTITRSTAIAQGALVCNAVSTTCDITWDWAHTPGVTCASGANGHPVGACAVLVQVGTEPHGRFRIHHSDFVNNQRRGIWIVADGVIAKGLIDHCLFTSPPLGDDRDCARMQAVALQNCQGLFDGVQVQNTPLQFGTEHAVYFEDNIIRYPRVQDGGLESYSCGRVVARFNRYSGSSQSHHGQEGDRATQQYEYFCNAFDTVGMGAPWSGRVHHIRSGSGFIWGNTYTPTVTGGMQLYFYRAIFPNQQPPGPCNGLQALDGNEGSGSTYPAAGWPCLDQPGWLFNELAGDGGAWSSAPSYDFGNRRSGAPFTATGYPPSHIQPGAEFHSETPSFTGATGVGMGLGAARPATCAPGAGYWATDEGDWNDGSNPLHTGQGQFYKCTAPDTWELHYTPYTYPHPLQDA